MGFFEPDFGNVGPNPKLVGFGPNLARKQTLFPLQYITKYIALQYNTLQYQSRINNNVVNSCPSCGTSPHDAGHIFSCRNNPTDLEVIDLWLRPVEVANFLGLI